MEMLFILFMLSTILLIGDAYEEENRNCTFNIESGDINNRKSEILSRRKRFIVFPDGSSFQLVFCTQTHGYLRVGDIVWFGTTAALAWELPSDPTLFYLFKDKDKLYGGNRRVDKHIYYLDERGKVIGKQSYHRKPIVNPAFAKRSVDRIVNELSIKRMHNMQKNTNYLDNLHADSIEFHRSGRKSLYDKVKTVLRALGWNGRECVLRMLCESKIPRRDQGTFLEEIMKITFTLPKGRDIEADLHKQYDEAHGARDCAITYPDCQDFHGLPLYGY